VIAILRREVDLMKILTTLATIAILIGCFSLPLIAGGAQVNRALADLQSAVQLDQKGEYREALQKYRTFLSHPSVQMTPLLHAYILEQVADVDNGLGDYSKADANAREALRLLVAANETNTPVFATAEGVLADALAGEGNYREAKNVAERAVSVGRATLSSQTQTPRFAILLSVLAHSLECEGERGRALKLYREAAGIMKNAGKGNRIELGTAYVNLAGGYLARGNAKKALKLISLAFATWKQVLPVNNTFTVYPLSLEVLSYEKLKSYGKAEALIPEMLEMGASRLGASHPDRVVLLDIAASVYIAEKRYQEAARFLEEDVELTKRLSPPGDPVSRTVLANYSYVLAKLGRTEEASRVQAESGVFMAFPER
jgi:tetratricopeptide (TPR) repeat protein